MSIPEFSPDPRDLAEFLGEADLSQFPGLSGQWGDVPDFELPAPELTHAQQCLVDMLDELLGLVKPDQDDANGASFVFMASALKSLRPEVARALAKVDDAKILEMVDSIGDKVNQLRQQARG